MTDPRRNLDERLRGNYGRFSTMALKLALVLSIMDWADDGAHGAPRITTAHWVRGQILAEEYRASAHRLLDELSVGLDVKDEKKLLDFIVRTGEHTPSAREILCGAGLPLVLTEGEFDALTTWQIGWGKVSVASIGSASNQCINLR